MHKKTNSKCGAGVDTNTSEKPVHAKKIVPLARRLGREFRGAAWPHAQGKRHTVEPFDNIGRGVPSLKVLDRSPLRLAYTAFSMRGTCALLC